MLTQGMGDHIGVSNFLYSLVCFEIQTVEMCPLFVNTKICNKSQRNIYHVYHVYGTGTRN